MGSFVSNSDQRSSYLNQNYCVVNSQQKAQNMENLFPWNSIPSDYKEQLLLFPIKGAVPLKKVQTSSDFQKHFVSHPHQLQLRGDCFVVVRIIDCHVLSFFKCQPSISILIKRMSTAMYDGDEVDNKKEMKELVVQMTNKEDHTQWVSLFFSLNAKEAMELYRTLAKTYTTQLDFHNQFKPFRKIGQGLTSTVYEVNRLVDNKRLAVKAFKKSHYFASSGGKGYHAFLQQFKILTQCSHQAICRFEGVYETDNTIYIVQQYYEKSLSKLLLSALDLKRKVVASLMEDMLRGLHYLHSKGIFHRDIKLDNIMLRKEGKTYRPVIIDMGMAHYTSNSEYLFDKCGSPGYVAPEVFTQGAKDPKGDVFSLGVIFYILLFKKAIFNGTTRQEILFNNRNANLDIDHDRLNQEDDLIKDLLLKMLAVDLNKRVTAEEALNHPLFRNVPQTPQTVCEFTNQELYFQRLIFEQQ